jgi:hypothetical protein
MQRPHALQAYQDYSARTSENVRQLSFAALAVVWVFRPEKGFAFPSGLLWAGTLAITALALDFLQSLYGTVAWGTLHRRKEREGVSSTAEFKAPRQINWPTNALFSAKSAALAASYALLLSYLYRLSFGGKP